MNFKQSVILFAMATLSLTIVINGQEDVEDLYKILARSNENDCFIKYGKYYNYCLVSSQNSSQRCVKVFDEEKQKANTDALRKRDELSTRLVSAFSSLSRCNTLGDAVEAFNCLNRGTSEATQIMDAVGTNANKFNDDLSENIRSCEKRKAVCTTDTLTKMTAATAQASKDLMQCITTKDYVWNFPAEYIEANPSEAP